MGELTEYEVQLYMAYAIKKPLPNRVLELQLAQISQHTVNMASEKNKFSLKNFLLHEESVEVELMSERDALIAFGFNPK